jgi:hypothetical protein
MSGHSKLTRRRVRSEFVSERPERVVMGPGEVAERS